MILQRGAPRALSFFEVMELSVEELFGAGQEGVLSNGEVLESAWQLLEPDKERLAALAATMATDAPGVGHGARHLFPVHGAPQHGPLPRITREES
jgi:hypothetical protein